MHINCRFLLNLLILCWNVMKTHESKCGNVAELFPELMGNLTAVTWAHAVNSKQLLEEALNSTVMMLEADVVLGQIEGRPTPEDTSIMAHPPQTVSTLSLEDFLKTITIFNLNTTNSFKKGIKLDFKSIEAFERSIELLNSSLNAGIYFPVWLNADILPGPVNSTDTPVDANRFINAAKLFTNSTFSLGWKTLCRKDITSAAYMEHHIHEMILLIKENNITQEITFPVRASIAANSLDHLQNLMQAIRNSTLTLWHAKDDYIDIEKLRLLVKSIGIYKIFIDIPDAIKNKLELNKIH